MVVARLSGQLRKLANGREEVNLAADDIAGCINSLEQEFPGAKERFCDEKGELLDAINIYINGDNIRSLQGLSTPLKEGDEVDFMSAFAAG